MFTLSSPVMHPVLHAQAASFKRPFPELRPGYTVRVHQKVQEGEKERIQVFEGLILSVHGGAVSTDTSFTVRRVVEGVGVEKVFPLCSSTVTKIEVLRVAPVRRAKLYFLRGRSGKAARLSERFTTSEEFAVAVSDAKPAESLVEESVDGSLENQDEERGGSEK